MLVAHCHDIRGEPQDSGNELWTNLHPYYTDEEIARIADECDEMLATIPEGCAAVGVTHSG